MNSWLRDIDRATTQAEILAHTRDYLSLVHPRDLEVLPQELRTIRIERDTDIPVWRERLAKGCASVHAPPNEVARVQEMVSYLSKAAERLGQLRPPG
ncbi:MAG TPA: hypothetical protein VH040_03070 [Usitatibacter sp.]|jgi:hypothetical protein|nr:hypothetical protein [Usitatibacter sp.]